MKASNSYVAGEAYKALDNAFIDGIEVALGSVETARVIRSRGRMANLLHLRLRSLIVKNLLIQARGKETVVWVTFNPETTKLDSWTMFNLR